MAMASLTAGLGGSTRVLTLDALDTSLVPFDVFVWFHSSQRWLGLTPSCGSGGGGDRAGRSLLQSVGDT
jgi:hypothetical protein